MRKAARDAIKSGMSWVGGASGVVIPGISFFTSLPPPLFPFISFVTAALSCAVFAIVTKHSKPSGRFSERRAARRGGTLLGAALALLVIYVLALQVTTVLAPPVYEDRIQIGFGTADWTLTSVGREWKMELPTATPSQLIEREAAFEQERVTIIWKSWSVFVMGFGLIVLYLAGFLLWTFGFAVLRPKET